MEFGQRIKKDKVALIRELRETLKKTKEMWRHILPASYLINAFDDAISASDNQKGLIKSMSCGSAFKGK